MATSLTRISPEAHASLMQLVMGIQEKQKEFSSFRDRLARLDESYARSSIDLTTGGCDSASDSETTAAIKVPIVNSEVDSLASYLIGVFVSGTPLFPVVSENADADKAMQLQAMIDRDARYQRWGRQLVLFCKKAARYSIAAMEVERITYDDQLFNKSDIADTGPAYKATTNEAIKLNDLDMYNLLFDYRVAPADVTSLGEYVGYNKIISRTYLRRLVRMRSEEKIAYNISNIRTSKMVDIESYYNEPPDISDVTRRSLRDSEDWLDWAGIDAGTKFPSSAYFYTRLYIWLAPGDVGINAANANTPRIVRLEIINNQYILSYKEIVTPMDLLPIVLVDISEEGFAYQTKSVGEKMKAYQDMATELLHSKLEGSKRAIGDRAIYDAAYISPTDVNAKTAAPKIPMKTDLRNSGDRPRPSDVYYSIPFDSRGLLDTMSDLNTIMTLKDQVNGINMAMRGVQTPGNRSATEFSSISNRAEGKMLPYALLLEEQGFIPMKLMIKFFILASTKLDHKVLDTVSRKAYDINIAELRQVMLDFKMADGLRPKAVFHNPEALSMAIQFLQNSEEMQQAFDIGDIFAEIMATWNIEIGKFRRQIDDSRVSQPIQPSNTQPADLGAGTADTGNGTDEAIPA